MPSRAVSGQAQAVEFPIQQGNFALSPYVLLQVYRYVFPASALRSSAISAFRLRSSLRIGAASSCNISRS